MSRNRSLLIGNNVIRNKAEKVNIPSRGVIVELYDEPLVQCQKVIETRRDVMARRKARGIFNFITGPCGVKFGYDFF